ncbi:MAG: hypothetical protein V4717_22805 [Bacteroidota bacterium]
MTELLHDFYADEKCPDFSCMPTPATSILLANYKAMFKMVGNKLIVLIKTGSDGKPFIIPDPSDRFTFYMALQQPAFITVSNLGFNDLSGKRFYFTNLHQNKVTEAGKVRLYVTKQILPFDATTNYLPGEMVKQSNVIYEALASSTGSTPPNTANWITRKKNQYASKEDVISFITKQHVFSLQPAVATASISCFGLNTVTGLFDVKVFDQIQHFETPVDQVAADFSSLPDGKYRVELNGAEFFVYLSNEAVYNNVFGVIELYNHLPAGNDFAFVDGTGKVKDQTDILGNTTWLNYTIRFANKVAFWKYIVPKKGVKEFETHPDYSFAGNADPLPSDVFVSNLPIPLYQQPRAFKLTLFNPISSEPPLAANPNINASGMLTKVGADYFCNIYLNY